MKSETCQINESHFRALLWKISLKEKALRSRALCLYVLSYPSSVSNVRYLTMNDLGLGEWGFYWVPNFPFAIMGIFQLQLEKTANSTLHQQPQVVCIYTGRDSDIIVVLFCCGSSWINELENSEWGMRYSLFKEIDSLPRFEFNFEKLTWPRPLLIQNSDKHSGVETKFRRTSERRQLLKAVWFKSCCCQPLIMQTPEHTSKLTNHNDGSLSFVFRVHLPKFPTYLYPSSWSDLFQAMGFCSASWDWTFLCVCEVIHISTVMHYKDWESRLTRDCVLWLGALTPTIPVKEKDCNFPWYWFVAHTPQPTGVLIIAHNLAVPSRNRGPDALCYSTLLFLSVFAWSSSWTLTP